MSKKEHCKIYLSNFKGNFLKLQVFFSGVMMIFVDFGEKTFHENC